MTTTTTTDPNAQFRVLTIRTPGHTREVYLLNPGNHFARFGGSSAGLTVRKTASLIIRDIDASGTRDTECALNDPSAWNAIKVTLALPGVSMS